MACSWREIVYRLNCMLGSPQCQQHEPVSATTSNCRIQTNGRDPGSHRTAGCRVCWLQDGGTEQSAGVSKLPLAKPVRQIEHDSGKESGFSHPQQKAHNKQVDSCFHEASQHRHNSPTDQYPCNPDTRSELVQH